ncbi:FN3 associated domain-containing protein [Halobacillus sp. K22]|uniref:FN3 associated domain-containing protein n=1 Tax=Halobacillus sp. K22 TaxID=3457431 RepID=UPI003FCD7844
MKKVVAGCLVTVMTLSSTAIPMSDVKAAEAPADLFISEYVEGSSFNKALELYNGTGSAIDLSGYTLELYSNGATEASQTQELEGTLASGETFVIADSQAAKDIIDKADLIDGIVSFNGNDPLVLKKDGEIVDSFGQVGNGSDFANDVTLVRKASITSGDTDPTDSYDVSAEWDSYAKDTFDYLGSYEVNDTPDTPVETVSIAEARQSEKGSTVSVQGIATAAFESGGQTNLYIQDESAGIIVRAPGITAQVGDQITASGEIGDYYGMEQIQTSSAAVEVTEEGVGVPEPERVSALQFSADQGESIEGEFVEVNNVEITDVNEYGDYTAEGAEGTFLITPAEENLLRVGDSYEQIKGVVNYSFNNYKLVPRSKSDIVQKAFAVTANKESGAVITGTEIILSAVEPGVTIHYTTDGSEPTAESKEYTEPITITKDTTIKAAAVRDNGEVSEVSTFSYTALKAADSLEIHDIQGSSHTSPYEGEVVKNVEGVVTKLDGSNGFYMQSLNPDDDIATSEGIYVYKRSSNVAVGDVVTATGEVTEWREDGYSDANDLLTTQISASTINVESSGTDIPKPVVIGEDREQPTEIIEDDGLESFDPAEDGIDFYESLEGMLIELPEPKVSGPVKYDELPVYVETSENQLFTRAEGLLISPDDYNPERVLIDVDGIDINAKTGDYFDESITGVVNYDYSNYKIRPTGEFPEIKDGGTERESADLKALKKKMTVASYNVENFSADTSPEKVEKIAESIIQNLNTPDVVGLIEVQDNNGPTDDGTVEANESYQKLIDAIAEAGGPKYEFTDIAPQDKTDGGQPGGNIRVGFIYNPERVTLTDKPDGDAVTGVDVNEDGLTLNPGRVDPTNDAFDDSRKPLAAEFEFNGEKVVVVANHFNSKGGDDGLFGADQPVELGSEEQRIQQATVINNFVQKVENEVDDSNVVVLGDLNDFQFSAPINTLEGDILTNMIESLPTEEQYTYIYQGNSQVLDHILVSNNLAKQTKVQTVNINSDFSEADGRASDHDPVLAQIMIKNHGKKDKGEEQGKGNEDKEDKKDKDKGSDNEDRKDKDDKGKKDEEQEKEHKYEWVKSWIYSIWNKYFSSYFN